VRTSFSILILFGILMLMPATVAADWSIAPFLGRTFHGQTTLIDHEGGAEKGHWHFGAATTFSGSGPVAAEGLVTYTPRFFQTEDTTASVNIVKSRALAIMGNAVLTMPQRRGNYGLRPFFSGGIGVLHASATDFSGLTPVSVMLPGYNLGGGAVGFFTDRAGMRFDLRYFGTLKEKELKPGEEPISIGPANLSYWTASVGVVFRY
jgi:hypothetical protein